MKETKPQIRKPKKSVALSGVEAGDTAICTVGLAGNDLHYRGYDIMDFAATAEFEEIAQNVADHRLVVDDQNSRFLLRTNWIRQARAPCRVVSPNWPQGSSPGLPQPGASTFDNPVSGL